VITSITQSCLQLTHLNFSENDGIDGEVIDFLIQNPPSKLISLYTSLDRTELTDDSCSSSIQFLSFYDTDFESDDAFVCESNCHAISLEYRTCHSTSRIRIEYKGPPPCLIKFMNFGEVN
jgi:hypothetical protein